MSQAKKGNTVKVHYTGKLEDGTIFDSSKNREPLEFTIGDNKVIPGFENAVIDMNIGDTKTITLAPEEAYGPYRKELEMVVGKDQLPQDMKPEVGQQLQIKQEKNPPIIVTITNIADKEITLDANHPLAGKTLIFDIELVEIN